MAGDILLEMLFDADEDDRIFCAKRLIPTQEAPRRVLRYLGMCSFEVAGELLEQTNSFDDSACRSDCTPQDAWADGL